MFLATTLVEDKTGKIEPNVVEHEGQFPQKIFSLRGPCGAFVSCALFLASAGRRLPRICWTARPEPIKYPAPLGVERDLDAS